MQLVPDVGARETLLRRLSALCRERGWEPFALARILEPSPSCFPEPWRPDETGARLLALRLLRWAGLGALQASVTVFDQAPEASGAVHAVAWFAGIEDGVCRFGVRADQLTEDDAVVGAMCHEVAHAFRRYHGIEDADPDREEDQTDLTTVYLGFGLLTLQAAERHRTTGRLVGSFAVHQVRSARTGYLSLPSLAFLLAVQCAVRDLSPRAWRALARELPPNQRACFEAARALVMDDGPALRARLGIPEPPSWPEPVQPDLSPIQGELGEPPRTPAPRRAPKRRVYRAKDATGLGGALAGVAAGLATLLLLDLNRRPGAVVLLLVGLPVVGYWIRRSFPPTRCSDPDCASRLAPEDERCPGCGGVVAADIDHPDDRLELEDLVAEHGRKAGFERYRALAAERAARAWRPRAAVALAVIAVAAAAELLE